MKRVYELDVYKLAEELSDMVWYDFDKWDKKVMKSQFPISIVVKKKILGLDILWSSGFSLS
ncbi:MAG: hypothetical protein QME81_00840 [bacterium]|nr:hypothetical protein [bacterium]